MSLQGAGTMVLDPGASATLLRLWSSAYFSAHSQKFHQTPVWFGMNFTPVMRSL
ncbi:hypothetical protein SRABI83_02151 [Arthrobacter sp. Bi83]|nr:hypothetical protein SRABI83_02151 [Arthrobacter sp. Bi83]